MALYETTFIVNPQTDDATIDRHVKAVTDIITEAGGKIVYENRMGTRRLAYAINKLTQGYYANFIFEAPKTVVSQLDHHMRLDEAYMRHLTIVFEGPVPDKDAPPTDDFRYRPRGSRSDRPYGRRDSGRDRGRPEAGKPAERSPAPAAAPAEKAPADAPTAAPVEKAPAASPAAAPAEKAPFTPPAAAPAEKAPVTPPAAAPAEKAPFTPPAPAAPAATEPAPEAPKVEPEPAPPTVKPEPTIPAPPAQPPVSKPAATESKTADEEVYREEEEL